MTHLVIDGFETDLARVELDDGRTLEIPRTWLPSSARAGDWVTIESDGEGHTIFTIDEQATRAARERNQNNLDALNARDPGGDVNL